MITIGLDIGTTSVCITAVDADTGAVLEAKTLNNNCTVTGAAYERCQNPEKILTLCLTALEDFLQKFSPVCAIGLTGQMHGIVYLDKGGKPVSELYTWQDMSGDEPFAEGITYAQQLESATGYKAASGFGLTTLFVHMQKGTVPATAAKVCTIHDFVAMTLAGLTAPVMHTSDAASFGLFNLDTLDFDRKAIAEVGVNADLLPRVTAEAEVLGKYKDIPVCVAIGDNQASFIGSVNDTEKALLLNVGTGSQVSFKTASKDVVAGTELRPCHQGNFIRVGSALCGGRAFAALEQFIRATVNLSDTPVENAYPLIDRYLEQNVAPENGLSVNTAFIGTRDNPSLRGSVQNLGLDNFSPGHLIYGVLYGITEELYNMYLPCREAGHTYVVGSGNGLRKNLALQKIISEVFGLPLRIPAHKEEAAYGAVLYALTAVGYCKTLDEAQKLIQYQ